MLQQHYLLQQQTLTKSMSCETKTSLASVIKVKYTLRKQ